MIIDKDVDIFDSKADVIVHSCNCFCTMGGGIALEIARRFPEASEADQKTESGDIGKLGKVGIVKVKSANSPRFIANLYGQFDLGSWERKTNYEAIACGLEKIRDYFLTNDPNVTIAIPWNMGCGLGGGDWNVIEAIIYSIFEEDRLRVLICKKPELV